MAHHLHTGRKGEALAAEWLGSKGYQVSHVNWRYSHYEIDIIAVKENLLHFIEVKTRQSTTFGYPEESVSRKKFLSLQLAAEEYLEQHQEWKHVQYDVLAIMLCGADVEFFLIEDVFYME